MKKYKCSIQLLWIVTVWQCISLEVTARIFNKCCMQSSTDETDGDMLWNSSKEDGYVRSECEEGEGTDCRGGDSDTDW